MNRNEWRTESERFWYSVVCDLADNQEPVVEDSMGLFGETPNWVTKLATEVVTIVMPRLQFRVGQRPAPQKVGVMIGTHVALCRDILKRIASAMEEGDGQLQGFKLIEPAVRPFRESSIGEAVAELLAHFQSQMANVVERVLERPLDEASLFFQGMGRGLQKPKSPVFPAPERGDARPTNSQVKRQRTLVVYWVVLMNWKAIDRLKSSREAYDFLCRLLPMEVVGDDQERIRRMFSRLGKKFKDPGRPPTA